MNGEKGRNHTHRNTYSSCDGNAPCHTPRKGLSATILASIFLSFPAWLPRREFSSFKPAAAFKVSYLLIFNEEFGSFDGGPSWIGARTLEMSNDIMADNASVLKATLAVCRLREWEMNECGGAFSRLESKSRSSMMCPTNEKMPVNLQGPIDRVPDIRYMGVVCGALGREWGGRSDDMVATIPRTGECVTVCECVSVCDVCVYFVFASLGPLEIYL